MMQNISVACIVLACAAYSSWTLMPAAWRRALARGLLRSRFTAPLTRKLPPLSRAARTENASACAGCESCGSGAVGTAGQATLAHNPSESVLHFIPRKAR